MSPKKYSTPVTSKGVARKSRNKKPQAAEFFPIQKIRKERKHDGKSEVLIAWAPTWEPAEIDDPSFGKYKIKSVSHATKVVKGKLVRLVHWQSNWEPEDHLELSGIEEGGHTGGVPSEETLAMEQAPDGWVLQRSRTHKNTYFYNPSTHESVWEVPESD